jgi:phospholipid/cholesterol/gamma-HCH transport system substrate-binding protein
MALSVENKVGVFFAFGVIILGFMLMVGEKWNPFEKHLHYKTHLASTTGLKIGDPVRMSGVTVGRITDLVILSESIEIGFDVRPGTQIKTDSVAELRLTNLLGGQFLGISFGSARAALAPPGSSVAGRESANIDTIVNNMSNVTKNARVFIADLNQKQEEVLQKVSNLLDDNRGSVEGTISNVYSFTEKLNHGQSSLALLLNDRKLYTDAGSTIEEIKSVSGKMARGEATLGRLANDEQAYRDALAGVAELKAGIGDLVALMQNMKQTTDGKASLGKLVHDEALYNDMLAGTKNINDMARKINSGEGTVGKLVNDDQLYRDITQTLKKTDRALEGRGDPGLTTYLGTFIGSLF